MAKNDAIIPKLKMSMNMKPLERFAKQSPKNFMKAQERGAIQFLNWTNNGSAKSSKKPPIRWGVLRGSSSAFVGNKLVETFKGPITPGSGETPTPAQSHSAPKNKMTWVWNTDYATKMHEHKGEWGPATQRDADAGAKWLEDHLRADRTSLWEVIGREFKQISGL